MGLLGAQVVNRIDQRLLRHIGWGDAEIEQNAAEHLSITFSGGPRLDLFLYPQGAPPPAAAMHPHIALTVSPRAFLKWKRRARKSRRRCCRADAARPARAGLVLLQ